MTSRLFLAATAAVLLTAGALRAQEAPTRIGVVRIQQVFQNYHYAREMKQGLEAQFKSDKEEIEALQQKIRKAEQELRSAVMEPGSLSWKLRMLDIQGDKARLEDKMERFKERTRKAMAQFWRDVYRDFRKTIELFGAQQGYDLIITAPDTDLSEETLSGDSPMAVQNEILLRTVQFVSPRTDVTEAVLAMMNQMYDRRKAKLR